MPKRSYSAAGSYRYGFNGKENDNDVKGLGNQQDYGMRIYDARLGKFLSLDPLTKSYPWYTPYQFAGNKPIWAVDLDGMEEWYYYDAANASWKKSALLSGPRNPEQLNQVGFYNARQVHQIEEEKTGLRAANQRATDYHEANKAAREFKTRYNRLNNPVGLFLELNPVKGLHDAYYEFDDGNFLLGGVMVASSFGDFHSLVSAGSRTYSKLATSIAAKYSMDQIWQQFPLFRGMLAEAKLASNYIAKGYEWLAATASPFFRYFDFYNSATKTAVSLKTVNASTNLDFKNIFKNIEELKAIKREGKSAQFGREFVVNEVRLEIIIPKGYDKKQVIGS